MKKVLIYLLPVIIPVSFMIFVNAIRTPHESPESFLLRGVKTQNTDKQIITQCSWACHNNTNYCKAHHVKFLKAYFPIIDPVYYGIINGLKSFGDYQYANIIFLVIAWPALMYFLLVKSLLIELKIRKIKQQHA